MKTFLTLSFVGMVAAGAGLGRLIDGGTNPVVDALILALGVWLTIVALAWFRPESTATAS